MSSSCEVICVTVSSPLGPIELSGCEQGLHTIQLPRRRTPGVSHSEVPPLPAAVPEPLAQCVTWLDAYFRKPKALDELPLPPLHHPIFQKESFTSRVLRKLLQDVKFGAVVSYQQLAALAGNPRASRAVGGAMRNNPVPILIPCHRVICSSGAVGHYSGGYGVKEWLLTHEGSPLGKLAGTGGPWRWALGCTGDPLAAGRD